ncbi:alpha/beta hydrolase [Kineobactrum sediminis]|uniref:Alpha/beta hydrolase n=1 Tax=Kineobactrum sediminis TaxID=1905677 RepID=A0A2N5Y2R7_9GAMM|nr:alpha/beta hydrolase [Kineobactrum sediminis]PLW82694.1 alpha/beta hydrolase [Kineobactrum sediminis]
MVWFILALLVLFAFSLLYLRGENLSWLDEPPLAAPQDTPSESHYAVVAKLGEFAGAGRALRGKAQLRAIRDYMDSMSDGRDFSSSFQPVAEGQLRGEWVLAPGADCRRRLLYIHGGAWIAGSPKSHRAITDRLARLTGAAVFSLDYRLMPEYRRADGIEDCRNAWRWIVKNGPHGPEPLDYLMVAGDSAGGSLSLALLAWARDEGVRQADAAVVFSPSTDITMNAPSMRSNLATDPMLGPMFGKLAKIPSLVLLWLTWFNNRIRPSHPDVSPLRGELAGLPPVLVQASEQEMLLDDARRYVIKAQLAGSPVELQTWPHMVHVWQIFTPELPEAEEAYAGIAEFLAKSGLPLPGGTQA